MINRDEIAVRFCEALFKSASEAICPVYRETADRRGFSLAIHESLLDCPRLAVSMANRLLAELAKSPVEDGHARSPDPEPDCLAPWSSPMIETWLKNHPEWSLHCEYIMGHFQGWKCKCATCWTTGSTTAEAVQMAARIERGWRDKQDE